MKYEMRIERTSSDKVTVEFAKYHSTGASEFRSVDLYDDEVKMLKGEFCSQLEKKLAEAKKIVKRYLDCGNMWNVKSNDFWALMHDAEKFLKEE